MVHMKWLSTVTYKSAYVIYDMSQKFAPQIKLRIFGKNLNFSISEFLCSKIEVFLILT